MTRPRNDPRALVDGWALESERADSSDPLEDGSDPIHQQFERDWWGDCLNTFGEEAKQITYAHRMGLEVVDAGGHWPVYDLGGRTVLDIGGGPASLLLKCVNRGPSSVVDPCPYPEWTRTRYDAAKVIVYEVGAEDFIGVGYDEAWLYNVLLHVRDPEAVVETALRSAPVVRVFEWINTPPSIGHPHTLSADWLTDRFGEGTIEELRGENGCEGIAWYGVFSRE